ncbi:hypothetical protein D3C73_1444580 [compost metagenome]
MMATGSVAPSILRRTGPKSTNQSRKIAWAIASSVSFIRRFSSILSSNERRVSPITRWSAALGKVIRNDS